jgi:hypothetical protein
MMGRRGRRSKQLLDDLKGKEKILEIERGSTRSHCVENLLWKSLRTCRKTDCRIKRLRTCRKTDYRKKMLRTCRKTDYRNKRLRTCRKTDCRMKRLLPVVRQTTE